MKNIKNINNYVVYFHRNRITKDVFYVGIGNEIRAQRTDAKARSKYWNNYVKKYGLPIVEIVHKDLYNKDAQELEINYINKYGRKGIDDNGILVNRSTGGEKSANGFKHSVEARQKISLALKNRVYTYEQRKKIAERTTGKKHTEESKLKNSILHRGANHPQFGKPKSEETKRKIGEAHKGRFTGELSPVSRKVINTLTKDIFPSATYVANTFFKNYHQVTLYNKLNGRITNNTDFQYLDDYSSDKEKYINPNKSNYPVKIKNVITGEIYDSICEAARKNGVSDGAIHFHLKGKLTKSTPKYSYIN